VIPRPGSCQAAGGTIYTGSTDDKIYAPATPEAGAAHRQLEQAGSRRGNPKATPGRPQAGLRSARRAQAVTKRIMTETAIWPRPTAAGYGAAAVPGVFGLRSLCMIRRVLLSQRAHLAAARPGSEEHDQWLSPILRASTR